MKSVKLAWLLWRLVRRILRDSEARSVGASFTLVVESGAGYDERVQAARLAGADPAPPRRGCEVCYWPSTAEPAFVRRGHHLAEALEQVLRDR